MARHHSDLTTAYAALVLYPCAALQENSAIAVLDVATATITALFPMGLKDHSLPQNPLDPSDRDGGINIKNWPVFGMRMPDEIRSFNHKGVDFVATANEGDERDWPGESSTSSQRSLSVAESHLHAAAAAFDF